MWVFLNDWIYLFNLFIFYMYIFLNSDGFHGFPGDSVVEDLPPMQEMQVQSLSQEEPLE